MNGAFYFDRISGLISLNLFVLAHYLIEPVHRR